MPILELFEAGEYSSQCGSVPKTMKLDSLLSALEGDGGTMKLLSTSCYQNHKMHALETLSLLGRF